MKRRAIGDTGGIGSLFRYDIIAQIGEGTYGYVYKGRDTETSRLVALKKIIFQRDSAGFPLFAIREIKLLKALRHPNIVSLLNIVSSKGCEDQEEEMKSKTSTLSRSGTKPTPETDSYGARCGNTYLIFEYIEHDVGGLIDIKFPFEEDQIRVIMKQLLEVLSFLHEKGILHRDIKTSNLLLTNQLQLKLADFGLAREIYPVPQNLAACGLYGVPVSVNEITRPELTNNVITTWYRPPELLLGEKRYTAAVDMWSAGCVLGELFLSRPMFPGKTDIAQMELIIKAVGIPSEETWPGVTELPLYSSIIATNQSSLTSLQTYSFCSPSIRNVYEKRIPEPAISLLEGLLIPDPNQRLSARAALSTSYFHSCPDPTSLSPLNLKGLSCHEFETKSKKREAQNAGNAMKDSITDDNITNPPDLGIKTSEVLPGDSQNGQRHRSEATWKTSEIERDCLDRVDSRSHKSRRSRSSGRRKWGRDASRERQMDINSRSDERRRGRSKGR